MTVPTYQAPHSLARISREVPAYALMQLRNRMGGPVRIPKADRPVRVVLFPGLTAAPSSMKRLGDSLREAGCEVYDWGEGRNLGFRPDMLDNLDKRLRALSADGQKLTLIGWSMGGLIAREVAKCHPSRIEQVITLGSPFSGDIMQNNNAVKTYRLLAGHDACDVPMAPTLGEKPPVPTIALWSHRDGVVAAGAACGADEERDSSIEVACAHMSYGCCPDVIRAVAEAMGLGIGQSARQQDYNAPLRAIA